MARVEVARARATIVDSPGHVTIVMPSRKNWFAILFLAFWMCGWLIGEVSVLRELLRARSKLGANQPAPAQLSGVGGSLFLLAWLGGWTIGGCVAAYIVLWDAVGKEIVVLSGDALTIKRDILGFGRVRDFDLASVKNLRCDPVRGALASQAYSPWPGYMSGVVAFDYGAKTYRFGGGIDEPEARDILELLESRHHFDSDTPFS